MMVKFVSYNGVAYRVLHTGEGGMWLISYEEPTNPFFYIGDGLERIQTPEGFLEQSSRKKLTAAQQSRLALIHPLLDAQPRSITDRSYRLALAKEIAREQGTTYKRVLRLYYRYLVQGVLTSPKNCGGRESRPEFDWAIKTFYFSAKKFSLQACVVLIKLDEMKDTGDGSGSGSGSDSGNGSGDTPTEISCSPFAFQDGENVQQMMNRLNAEAPKYYEGYLTNGKPITKENIQAMLAEAEKGMPNGTKWDTSSFYN